MTENRLRELQELCACKRQLEAIVDNLDKVGFDITIGVHNFDIQQAEVHIQLYPELYKDFKQFMCTQYAKYKEAFDNA